MSILSLSPLAIDSLHPPWIYHMVTQLNTTLPNLPLGMDMWQGCKWKPCVLLLGPIFKEEAGYPPSSLCPFHGLAHQQCPTEPALAMQMEATDEGVMDNKRAGNQSWITSWDRPSPTSGLLHKREIKFYLARLSHSVFVSLCYSSLGCSLINTADKSSSL